MKKIFALAAAVIVISNFVFAEEEKAKEGPSIFGRAIEEVLSPLEDVFTPYYRLDPIVITSTRYADPTLNVSDNISVINERYIKDTRAKYIPDALRYEPGITVSDLLGNGKSVRVDMRGFGDSAVSNVLVLVDGRRVNQVDLSGADWVELDIDAVERIETVRGPMSVLYGDNATAGVVNIITKKGKGVKPEIAFYYDMGSYRYSSYKGSISGGTNFLDYFGMLSTSYNNGYRINNHLETVDYNANVTIKPTDHLKLTMSGGYHKDWYGLPGALKPVDINSIGRKGSIAPDNRAKTQDGYMMFTPSATADMGFGELEFSGDILARQRWTNAIYYSTWGDVANTHHIQTFGLTPKAAFTAEFLGIKNRLLAGMDYYGNCDKINSGELSAMDNIIIDKDTVGFYLTDTVEFLRSFIVNGGFRTEWAHYKFDQESVLQGRSTKDPFEYACEAGLVYKYNDRSSIYAQYSRSFRFPVTEDWYSSLYIDYFSGKVTGGMNLDLEPQTANSYEIGIKEYSSKYLNVNADYYLMNINNELYYDSITNKNAIYPNTIHHGLELKTDAFLMDSVHAFLNYTFQKAFFVGGAYAGNNIPMVPMNKISTGLKYTFKDCVDVAYSINYIGSRRFANDLHNTMPSLKEYVTHDIRFSYRKYGFEIYGAINNIFNEAYSEYGALDWSLTRPGYYPAPGTNASMGVRYSF
ncbi:MAG: TonB-dependent receptor [Candidatus Omnitrophota bacterium]|jgi:iron complex outermembrane receptor protein